MKLRRKEFCPIHRSLYCCGREPIQKGSRVRRLSEKPTYRPSAFTTFAFVFGPMRYKRSDVRAKREESCALAR
jgi:hypothetical protein